MSTHDKKNPWTTLSQQDVYENPWIKLEEHQVLNPSGGKGIYGKVHFKNTAIGIIREAILQTYSCRETVFQGDSLSCDSCFLSAAIFRTELRAAPLPLESGDL